MKKICLLLLTSLLSQCSIDLPFLSEEEKPTETESSSEIQSESESIESLSESEIEEDIDKNIYNEDYSNIKETATLEKNIEAETYFEVDYFDASFDSDNLIDAYKYENNKQVDLDTSFNSEKDYKYVFYEANAARFANVSDGYAITIPSTTTFEGDFSLGAYRSKLYNEESTITISKEDQNPYGNNYNSWQTYKKEWIIRHLEYDKWYEANNITKTRDKKLEDTTILTGYSIIEYDLEVLNPGNMTKCFYNIAVLRKKTDYINFYLIVMKSTTNRNDDFDKMIKSFAPISKIGTPNNSSIYNMAANDNPNWSENTKNYYHKLKEQEYTDWGIYVGNLPNDVSKGKVTQSSLNTYTTKYNKVCDDFDYDMDLISTYNHLSWSKSFKSFYFPLKAASEVCGNGFDGKPVLQFTYQYTDNNNNLSENSTWCQFSPMLELCRGKEDTDLFIANSYRNNAETALRVLAKAIKDYKNPVLFRLNNEMNTDWTSYCGLFNLLDPDLFAASWRILYDIFDEEGVDNCIFIFNPFTPSYPFCNWGKEMCYFPGEDYVQVSGLTYYVMNNDNEASTKTFESTYKQVYETNKKYFSEWPWIISEFACGSGESYQYQTTQTRYVEKMFEALNAKDRADWCKNIKGAIWFSCNDYYDDMSIRNALSFYVEKEDIQTFAVPSTVAGFKQGLANQNRDDK